MLFLPDEILLYHKFSDYIYLRQMSVSLEARGISQPQPTPELPSAPTDSPPLPARLGREALRRGDQAITLSIELLMRGYFGYIDARHALRERRFAEAGHAVYSQFQEFLASFRHRHITSPN